MKFQQKFIFILILFVICYKYAIADSIADPDLWHRMAVGKVFFQTGTVLKHDIFSYVLTKPLWIDHEWGSGVIFYFLADRFGDLGLLGLKFTILSSILGLIYITNNLISGQKEDLKIGFYTVSLMTIMLGFVNTIRCLEFTYLFFTLWIYILERARRGNDKLLLLLPLTMIFWVNLHAGFLSGIGLLILYIIGEFFNKNNCTKYILALIATVAATFINPYGLNFWAYIADAVTMTRPYVIEWMPTNIFGEFQEFIAFKILLFMTLTGYIYKYIKKDNKTDLTAILVLVVTLGLSLQHLRHQVFFGIAASIFSQHHYFYEGIKNIYKKISRSFAEDDFQKETGQLQSAKALFINISIVFICAGYIFMNPINVKASEPAYPANATEFIKINNLKGNLLTTFNWGSYALWKLYPQCKIFEDGRYEEVYFKQSDADLNKFMYEKQNWKDIFAKYWHDIILINNNPEIISKINSLNKWKIIYKDDYSTIFVPDSNKKNKWIMPENNINFDKSKYLSDIQVHL